MNIVFKNPPAVKRGRPVAADTIAISAALKARRGEWALVQESVGVGRRDKWRKLPGFEVRTVTAGKTQGKCDLYVRWVGEGQ